MALDLRQQYETVRTAAGIVSLARDVVIVTGPDAEDYLEGQLSQALGPLSTGESTWSFLLEPQGKVDAFVRVTRVEGGFALDTDAGYGDAVVARLARFKLRSKIEMEQPVWMALGVRGPAASDVAMAAELTAACDWPHLAGVDYFGPALEEPDDLPRCDAIYDVLRIEAGFPGMGSEITEKTIPAETGAVGRAVSFTKGCYTGQELVARIDSRGGNVPRRLHGVRVGGALVPVVGARIDHEGSEAGWVTSIAPHPDGGAVALAYVTRRHEAPFDATIQWDAGQAAARVEPLPLVS